jgi:hypothetical protein
LGEEKRNLGSTATLVMMLIIMVDVDKVVDITDHKLAMTSGLSET